MYILYTLWPVVNSSSSNSIQLNFFLICTNTDFFNKKLYEQTIFLWIPHPCRTPLVFVVYHCTRKGCAERVGPHSYTIHHTYTPYTRVLYAADTYAYTIYFNNANHIRVQVLSLKECTSVMWSIFSEEIVELFSLFIFMWCRRYMVRLIDVNNINVTYRRLIHLWRL